MNGLTIDVGNSAIKFAEFEDGIVRSFKREATTDLITQISNVLVKEYDYIALSTVKPSVVEQVEKCFPQIKIISSSDYDDMIAMYLGNPPQHGSYKELGTDIALGVFGALQDQVSDVIVIDSGTATTVTAVVNNVIEAVYIYPGFQLSKKSLIGNTEALDGDYSIKIKSGRAANTEACIDLAIYHGTNGAVTALINEIENIYERKFAVYITGGDTSEFYIQATKKDDKLVNIGIDAYMRTKVLNNK